MHALIAGFLFAFVALPTAVGAQVPATGRKVQALPAELDARQAQEARERAARALDELGRLGSSTAEYEATADSLRRGDEALSARSYAAAAALYRQAAAMAARRKTSGDDALQQAELAQLHARTAIAQARASTSGRSGGAADVQKVFTLAQAKYDAGTQALTVRNFSSAIKFFSQAASFAHQTSRSAATAVDTCRAATENVSRVASEQRRAESMLSGSTTDVAGSLVLKSKDLLQESQRQASAKLCQDSLRLSRLAENLLKRAAELMLQQRQ